MKGIGIFSKLSSIDSGASATSSEQEAEVHRPELSQDDIKETLSLFLELNDALAKHANEIISIWSNLLSLFGDINDIASPLSFADVVDVLLNCVEILAARYVLPKVRPCRCSFEPLRAECRISHQGEASNRNDSS